jgi:hypothetical protein
LEYFPINYTYSNPVSLSIRSSSPINIYILNATNFGALHNALSYSHMSALSYLEVLAQTLPILIWHGNTFTTRNPNITYPSGDVFPNTTNVSEDFRLNSGISNSVYLVIDNTNGSASTSHAVVVRGDYFVSNTQLSSYALFFLISIILLILGSGLCFYTIFIKKIRKGK